jgi:hypothetical protein
MPENTARRAGHHVLKNMKKQLTWIRCVLGMAVNASSVTGSGSSSEASRTLEFVGQQAVLL